MARLYLNQTIRSLAERYPAVDRALRRIESTAVDQLWRATRRRPIEQASSLGGHIAALLGPRMRKHKHVLRNLEIVFPEKSPKEIRALARAVWRQIGNTLAEYPHMDTICGTNGGPPRVELINHVPPERFAPGHPGMVMVAMHQANWNLAAMAGKLGDFPLDVVFAEQKDGRFEHMIAAYRSRMPCGFLHVRDVPRRMIQALKAGRNVGLLVDHRIDNGDPVPFFGRDAQTTTIPARVALKLGTAVVPVRLERLAGVRFRITLGRPIEGESSAAGTREQAIEIMRQVHLSFEDWIRAAPQDWCCVKRRWLKAPSRTEQIGLFGRHVPRSFRATAVQAAPSRVSAVAAGSWSVSPENGSVTAKKG